jgi:hypothetical protein
MSLSNEASILTRRNKIVDAHQKPYTPQGYFAAGTPPL